MSKIKLYGAALIAAISFSTVPATAAGTARGEKSLGVAVGYNTRNESPTAGIFFQYSVSSYLRIAPDITYTLRRGGTDALGINVNLQVPFQLGSVKGFNIYPLAGVNYTSWNFHGKTGRIESDDVTSRLNRLGLNLGAGLEYSIKPTLKLQLQGKYVFTKSHCSTGVIAVGIGYTF